MMTAPNGASPNLEAIDITASMFVAAYKRCGVVQMMLYFAGYQVKFKSKRSYLAFDTGDILAAYRNNFEPYWQELQAKALDEQRQEPTYQGAEGEEALAQYVAGEVMKLGGGEEGVKKFLTRSGMAECGLLSKAKVIRLLKGINFPFG